MFDLFTPEARQAVLFAQRRAALRSATHISVVDLAHGALVDGVWASRLLSDVGLLVNEVVAEFVLKPRTVFHEPKPPRDFTPEARRAVARSRKLADRHSQSNITSAHLFIACLTVGDPIVDQVADEKGLDPKVLADGLAMRFGPQGSLQAN